MSAIDENFNSDELEAPNWLNAEFLIKILRNCEANSSRLELKHFTISPATQKGDHYASVMFRVKLEYCVVDVDKSKSLIIKTMPVEDGHKKEFLGDSPIFETEIGMYTEVLPRFEQILRDVGDETVFKAPCLYHQLSPHKVIVFEDIVPQGYEVLRERPAFNKEEFEAVLMKLAKWHAISYKINIEEPNYFDQYRENAFTLPTFATDPVMTDGSKNFVAAYKSHPKIRKYVPYFEKMQTELLNKCLDYFVEYRKAPQPNSCYVLCHGDLNIKNMMFKRNASNGKLEDVMLIDFQMCYVGANVLDLINAKFAVLDEEMRSSWPEYLLFYLTQFNETLKKIGFAGPVPTILQLQDLMLRHKYCEFFFLVTFLPIRFAMAEGFVDIAKILTSTDFHKSTYKNEKLIAELQRILPLYEELGYFEEKE